MNSGIETAMETDVALFHHDGYLVKPAMMDEASCDTILVVAREHRRLGLAPLEYEADVKYPGAPAARDATGGSTIRRLLAVYSRHQCFRYWATVKAIKQVLIRLFADDEVMMSQCHHNCVMAKYPGFSSATLWHQDSRYWAFNEQNLISIWWALGNETPENGCLWVIPGSHRLELNADRFDTAKFLRSDLQANKQLLNRAVCIELRKGDVLFFHSRLFHAAGQNHSTAIKYSLVYTYHKASNCPAPGTRSAKFPSISL